MISLSTLSFSTITSYYFTSTLYDVVLKLFIHTSQECVTLFYTLSEYSCLIHLARLFMIVYG